MRACVDYAREVDRGAQSRYNSRYSLPEIMQCAKTRIVCKNV